MTWNGQSMRNGDKRRTRNQKPTGEDPRKWYVRLDIQGRAVYVREPIYREFCEQVHRIMGNARYLEEHEVPITVVPAHPMIIEKWRANRPKAAKL